MGSTADKIKGYANEAAGSVKKNLGQVIGSEELEIKGAAQKLKGEARFRRKSQGYGQRRRQPTRDE